MASALKTGDVESATEMARMARRGSEMHDEGSLTESTTATSSAPMQRRRSRRRLSRKSHSFRSDRQRQREDTDPDPEIVAPLAMSDEEPSGAPRAGDQSGGGGGDGGGGPPGGEPVQAEDPPQPPPPPPPPKATYMRRFLGYLRFSWAFLESMMVSMTAYMNKFSRDYRHVSRCLAEEKRQLKVRFYLSVEED